jgi:hypothetical protein
MGWQISRHWQVECRDHPFAEYSAQAGGNFGVIRWVMQLRQ